MGKNRKIDGYDDYYDDDGYLTDSPNKRTGNQKPSYQQREDIDDDLHNIRETVKKTARVQNERVQDERVLQRNNNSFENFREDPDKSEDSFDLIKLILKIVGISYCLFLVLGAFNTTWDENGDVQVVSIEMKRDRIYYEKFNDIAEEIYSLDSFQGKEELKTVKQIDGYKERIVQLSKTNKTIRNKILPKISELVLEIPDTQNSQTLKMDIVNLCNKKIRSNELALGFYTAIDNSETSFVLNQKTYVLNEQFIKLLSEEYESAKTKEGNVKNSFGKIKKDLGLK